MHIPRDSLLLPCSKKPQVWDISGPFKYQLFQREPGVPRFIFGMSSGAPRPESTCHPPGCFSKGKSCFSKGKTNFKPPYGTFSPAPSPPTAERREKKNHQTLPGVVSFFSPISSRLNPNLRCAVPKNSKAPEFLFPLSFIHCGSLNSRGLGSRLPGIKSTFLSLWLP